MKEINFDKEAFTQWLLSTPEDITFCEGLRILECPLAKFAGCQVGSGCYWPTNGYESHPLPQWASDYANRFDRLHGWTRAHAIEALDFVLGKKGDAP